MVTPADMKRVTDRWGRVANRLPAHEIKYGLALVQCLKKRSFRELAYFDDPVEAAMVFATIEVLKRRKRVRESFDP